MRQVELERLRQRLELAVSFLPVAAVIHQQNGAISLRHAPVITRALFWSTALFATTLVATTAAATAPPPLAPVLWGEAGLGAIGTVPAASPSFLSAVGGGVLWKNWRLGGRVSATLWETPLVHEEGTEWLAALHMGPNVAFLFLDGQAISSLTIGPSVLLGSAAGIQTYGFGFFVDLRPLGYRVRVSRRVRLNIDPLGVHIGVPHLEATPVVQAEFFTLLGMEVLP